MRVGQAQTALLSLIAARFNGDRIAPISDHVRTILSGKSKAKHHKRTGRTMVPNNTVRGKRGRQCRRR